MFNMRACRMKCLLSLLLAGLAVAALGPVQSALCDTERRLSVTVYSQDLALVRDTRRISFDRGVNEVQFADVASRIDPTSVLVLFPGSGPQVDVFSQRYRFDVAGMGRLLEIALEQEVSVRTEGAELHRGMLVGYDSESLIVSEE